MKVCTLCKAKQPDGTNCMLCGGILREADKKKSVISLLLGIFSIIACFLAFCFIIGFGGIEILLFLFSLGQASLASSGMWSTLLIIAVVVAVMALAGLVVAIIHRVKGYSLTIPGIVLSVLALFGSAINLLIVVQVLIEAVL